MGRVLVGCEESQVVAKAFRKLGHEAYSCDLLPCSGGNPEWHFQEDIFKVIEREEIFNLVILHPPCTAVAVSGNATYAFGKPKYDDRLESVKFTQKLWDIATTKFKYVMMENPVGCLNTMGDFPKPQYIQPWQFGHGETKKTGLWLHNLPHLLPTDVVDGREQRIWKMGPSEDRGKLRSKTFQGIADAIANQYGKLI